MLTTPVVIHMITPLGEVVARCTNPVEIAVDFVLEFEYQMGFPTWIAPAESDKIRCD